MALSSFLNDNTIRNSKLLGKWKQTIYIFPRKEIYIGSMAIVGNDYVQYLFTDGP